MKPNEFLQEMSDFFSTNFPEFRLFDPINSEKNVFAFYANYEHKLSIVVYPSISRVGDRNEIRYATNDLKFFIKGTKEKNTLIVLKDTPRRIWKKGTYKKVKALRKLIKSVKPCPICGKYPVPKKRTRGAKFVSWYCKNCSEYFSIEYGKGIKTDLNKHLK